MRSTWKLTAQEKRRIVCEYVAGESCNSLGARYGVDKSAILSILHYRGISRRKRGQQFARSRYSLNECAFDLITEAAAYWVGFLMGDGCIREQAKGWSPRLSLKLGLRDKEHVAKLRSFLGATHPIRYIAPNLRSGQKGFAQFGISSTRVVLRLADFGVVPRKSCVAKVLLLQDDRHFWRGLVDADGHVGVSRSRGRAVARLGLCGSPRMIDQFLAFVRQIVPRCKQKAHSRGRICAVSFTCRMAREIMRHLYSPCVIALDRKLSAARNILCGAGGAA